MVGDACGDRNIAHPASSTFGRPGGWRGHPLL